MHLTQIFITKQYLTEQSIYLMSDGHSAAIKDKLNIIYKSYHKKLFFLVNNLQHNFLKTILHKIKSPCT